MEDKKQQAVLNAFPKRGIATGHRKEKWGLGKGYLLIANTPPEWAYMKRAHVTAVDLRIYYGRGERVYACIWTQWPDCYLSGSGWAGGAGYDKPSAAAAGAITAAGITLSRDIDGRGESAIREALYAIGSALGIPEGSTTVIETHP